MADANHVQAPLNSQLESKLINESQQVVLNNHDDNELRFRSREQLIEKLERVIQEKNASLLKLEERKDHLEDALQKRNVEFHILEQKLKQFEEKTHTFEQLHQLQVQTFEKTIRDCQIENERLCEQINESNRELREKTALDEITKEKLLTFDRIVADTKLWRQKLDSYKQTIEQREQTITNLKEEINDLQRKKHNTDNADDNALRLQISTLQNTVQDRDKEIERLKTTLRRVRDTLHSNPLSHGYRWKSCSENLDQDRSQVEKRRSGSPSIRNYSSPLDVDTVKKKFQSLTDRLNNVQQLLVKRDEQVGTLKKVHDKRWLRLKHLQKQYNTLKDELQSYTDDDILQKNTYKNEYFYRKAVRKTRNGCSICNDHRWRKQKGLSKKVFKQEDDDQVWNELTRIKRENTKLNNENLSLHEKIDLQEVEINEQRIVIDELRNEIQRLNDNIDEQPTIVPIISTNNGEEEKLKKKIYELENERINLIFENERLKTNYELCLDEKQQLMQNKMQANNEIRKLKLRILALQDQIHKLKRNNQLNNNNNNQKNVTPTLPIKRRMLNRKRITKSCLEVLLDENSTIIDDLQDESLVTNRRRQHSCSLCEHQSENSSIKRKRQTSTASTISKTKYGPLKRCSIAKSRLPTPLTYPNLTRKSSASSTTSKVSTTRISALHKRLEQLEIDLAKSREENEHLNQRLTTTLSRINFLKTTNQKLTTECDKLRTNPPNQSTYLSQDTTNVDSTTNMDSLYERLKNTSLDAAQQRKLNKNLLANNEVLNKNLQSSNEKLTHAERDIASKRLLIENYKVRLMELETNLTRSSEKNTNELKQNDDERVKALTETSDKLRISVDSYKNRLQAITREKHELDTRYNQLVDEHQKLKIRYEELQSKSRSNEQQLRQIRMNNEQLNQELLTARNLSEQQLLTLNSKSQDSLKKITVELDRTLKRLNEYENFINALVHDITRRSTDMNDSLRRAREQKKQRDSLSVTLPGYDTAMNTASRILNLTQDDLDEILSINNDSFQANPKQDNGDKNEKMRQKVAKLLISQEECSNKLLKIFSKKLDELQTTDRELTLLRNA